MTFLPFAVVGDVHGNVDALKTVFQKVTQAHGALPFYSTGDLIDRGPSSKDVLDFCIQHQIMPVKGNHEEWMIDVLSGGAFDRFTLHAIMGGRATLNSYGISLEAPITERIRKTVPQDHQKFLKELPDSIVIGDRFVLSHTGVGRSCWANPTLGVDSHLLSQSKFIQIIGHLPVPAADTKNGYFAIDTGCSTVTPSSIDGWEGYLTAIVVSPDIQGHSVQLYTST